jgi:hypothetical protein
MFVHFFGLPVDRATALMVAESDCVDKNRLRVIKVNAVTKDGEAHYYLAPRVTMCDGFRRMEPASVPEVRTFLEKKCRDLGTEALSDDQLIRSSLIIPQTFQPHGDWFSYIASETEDLTEFVL